MSAPHSASRQKKRAIFIQRSSRRTIAGNPAYAFLSRRKKFACSPFPCYPARLTPDEGWWYIVSVMSYPLRMAIVRKNLVKHGNSLALIIEKPILELLGADADTPFDITTDGQVLVLNPAPNPKRRKAFHAALEKANRTYAEDLKKLAE